VQAVAGSVLVRNSRDNLWTRMQEWDYFLGIASVKRMSPIAVVGYGQELLGLRRRWK
jgi:hypothetical protein